MIESRKTATKPSPTVKQGARVTAKRKKILVVDDSAMMRNIIRQELEDGGYEAFDSAIGLFIYLHFPGRIGIKLKPVAGIYFMDYLKETWLEADNAFFVTGSDIRGPMGVQFLPVDSEQAAYSLKKNAHGKGIVHFKMINRQYLIDAAEAGQLHKMAKKLVLK